MSDSESESISNEVRNLEIENETNKLFAFNIPNCLNISSLFVYGLSNVDSMFRNQALLYPNISTEKDIFKNSNQHIIGQNSFYTIDYFNLKKVILNLVTDDSLLNDFYFFYDRNPLIISNLIKIYKSVCYEDHTLFCCLDDNLNDDKFILKKLHEDCKKYQKIVFYSNNFHNSLDIPLYSHKLFDKETINPIIFSLSMAIGIEKQICCLRLYSSKKSYHFCNGNLTEEDIFDSLLNFSPFFLLYQTQYLCEKAKKYTHNMYRGCYNPSPPNFGYDDDISKKFIKYYQDKWTQKEYIFSNYLIECLKFPNIFVAGTDYPYEKYAHFITVCFTIEPSAKENYLKDQNDEDFKKKCRDLFIFYQKFLSFTRYLCSLIKCFKRKNSQKFIEAMKMTFSLIPVVNALIVSSFFDLLRILVYKFDAPKREKSAVEAAFEKFYNCAVDDGSESNQHLNTTFDFNRGFNMPPITVYQAYVEISKCFKFLDKNLDKEDLEIIRKIITINHDKSKDLKFYSKFIDSILSASSQENDIVI